MTELAETNNETQVAPAQQIQHSGVFLPAKPRTADAIWREFGGKMEISQELRETYDSLMGGGGQSFTDRTITLKLDKSDEQIMFGAKVSTKVEEVLGLVSSWKQVDPNSLTLYRKSGNTRARCDLNAECPSSCIVTGVVAGQGGGQRSPKQYPHPLILIGGGLGAVQNMVDLLHRDRKDFLCIEKHPDYGGHSWIEVPNKFTKLQTERGTYHVDYILPWKPVTEKVDGEKYKTWPSKNQIMAMIRESAREYGLYEHAMFNLLVEKVKPVKDGSYACQYIPTNDSTGDGGMQIGSAVLSWPGFLHIPNTVDIPGEEDFGGYIEYSSFDKVDYEQTRKKVSVLYGHGAFSIENVRTLVEHCCKKVWVVCRTRNLCGMKMVSWLVGYLPRPIPGNILCEGFQKMYDLVGFDVWGCNSVTTDKHRTFAHLQQKTIFGVTDVYFLAGWYGLMEVVEDDVKRLSKGHLHTKKGTKIACDVLIKAIGTAPSFKVDKQLGIKQCVGFWVNGDPLRPISMGAKGVQAKNFGSFSVGPGFAPTVKQFDWFIDFPEDFNLMKDQLPTNKAGKWPAFVSDASYGLPVGMIIGANVPMLAMQMGEMDGLKSRKQQETHPIEEYLEECMGEWRWYIDHFRKNGMIGSDVVPEKEDPPYPFDIPYMKDLIDKATRISEGEKVELI